MRKFCLFFLLIIGIDSCKKEQVLLTGDIIGRISVYNEDRTTSVDNSGINVNLIKDTNILKIAVTDFHGQYRFENIGYGKYKIKLQKEKYVESGDDYAIYHIGGYSPTIRDGSMYEIPDYILTIDSLKLINDYTLQLYLTINGDSIPPFHFYYPVIGFCSTSPEVTKDNYSFMISGNVSWQPLNPLYKAYGEIFNNVESLNSSDTYYLRFYLMVWGFNFDNPLYKQALGRPSNVISFKW
jgi:hypothetical protein